MLQHKKTGLFVEKINKWTEDYTRALAFESTVAAALFATTNKLREIRLLVDQTISLEGVAALSPVNEISNFPFS